MRNFYADLCLTVQAARRHFEGLRTPLAPATGVGAFIYTHQVANAFRVLTDVRVRHLLADEVGLGKTVQALMILNALRYQRRDLRALVVVPDELVTQWRDEILTRAHSVPIGDEEGGEGPQYIRLAWEDQLRRSPPDWTLADIDPDRYDVLVVDELHRLRSDLQNRLVRVAARFEHVLLLTATPAFQDSQRHAHLFAMLEPERSALAMGADEAEAAVVARILERDRSEALSCEPEELTAIALARCAYRRVIRTRRADYGGVLPNRKHIPILIEPLGVEEERQALMWNYFGHLGNVTLEVDPVRLAKRVILSPPSLEQRVDFLRRKGHERSGLLERAKPLVHRSRGDSRADALIDLLSGIWSRDPSERVLVAAQDNLTVDYLFDIATNRLALIGPMGRRGPLVAARIRQGMMTDAVEDLAGYGNETNENLELFQRGEAQVLFAPEAAQVGLNLQCARIVVLYSVPWRPEEVEQWIGRLDRIGNAAAFAPNGEAKTIEIYTIAQKGLVDEKVVTVLQRFHAFERSVNLDGEHLEEVAGRIESAALRPGGANWRSLERATESMAAQDDVKELESELRPFLPWTVEWASDLRKQLDALPPAPLAISRSEYATTGPRSWDRGVEGLLKLLRRADEYHIKWNEDPNGGRFQSLWYRFGELGPDGQKTTHSSVVFEFGADPSKERSPRHAHAFITRRKDIATPPRRHVTLRLAADGDSLRPLHFVNFGNALHDELVEEWRPKQGEAFSVDVALPEDHAFFEFGEAGLYVVRLSVLDPAACLQPESVAERALHAIAEAAARTRAERLSDLMRPFSRAVNCAIEADVRWLRGQLTAQLLVEGMKVQRKRWVRAARDEVSALLDPMSQENHEMPRSRGWPQTEQERRSIKAALDGLRASDPRAARSFWSPRLPDFDSALETRSHVVREEARDAAEVAGVELAKAESTLSEARDRGNPGQITRANNERDAAADIADMTRVMWDHRETWLTECRSAIRNVLPEERLTAVLLVRPAY